MADVYDGPFAGVTDVTQVVSDAATAKIVANIALVKALIPDGTAVTNAKPDFDQIMPHTAEKLRLELDALNNAIEAAPTV